MELQFEGGLFADIVIIFAAAAVGGLTARALRFPVLLGYLAVGIIIGPHVLQVIDNIATVQTLAEFGIVLLLFGVGIQISFRDLYKLGRVVILGGVAQIVLTVALVYPIGVLLLGWRPEETIVLGLVIALSSTMVVLKTLTDRGELQTLHGRLLTGLLLIQDLAFIPMIAILPALRGDSFLPELGIGLLKAAAVLGAMVLLGSKGIPWLLHRVTRLGSRETFIITVVALTLTLAAITQNLGLSAALGAFVAGLLLSETDFGHRALSEVVPLRDTLGALFFVSLGMLTDPTFVMDNFWLVLLILAVVMIPKFAITTGLVRAFGYLPRTALLTGLGMMQVGEFSFILVGSAVTLGIVGPDFLSLIVVTAVLSMAMTPAVMAGGSRVVDKLGRQLGLLKPYGLNDEKAGERIPPLQGHAIVCGLGRVGHLVAEALSQHDVPFIVIDLDPHNVMQWRKLGYHAIHGSSSSETVLEAARVQHARLMVVCIGDPIAAWVTAQHAIRINPDLDIVARVNWRGEGERFQQLGVQEVVWPQMEAGLEMLRHSLHRYRTDPEEVDQLVVDLREHLSFGVNSEAEGAGLPEEGAPGSLPDLEFTPNTVELANDD